MNSKSKMYHKEERVTKTVSSKTTVERKTVEMVATETERRPDKLISNLDHVPFLMEAIHEDYKIKPRQRRENGEQRSSRITISMTEKQYEYIEDITFAMKIKFSDFFSLLIDQARETQEAFPREEYSRLVRRAKAEGVSTHQFLADLFNRS